MVELTEVEKNAKAFVYSSGLETQGRTKGLRGVLILETAVSKLKGMSLGKWIGLAALSANRFVVST